VAALKCFFRFLEENEQIDRAPARVLRTPKKREALPDVLDSRELARLLDATSRADVWKRRHDGKRQRDRLLLALFAFAGLRRSELRGLDWQDVDLERRLLKIRRAKGDGSLITRADRLSSADTPSPGRPHGSEGFTQRRWRPKTPNDERRPRA
jgi:site-specific recombinase XerD